MWLAAGELLQRNGDVFHAYRPHSDFFYATGISEPGWGCLLDVETGEALSHSSDLTVIWGCLLLLLPGQE